MAFRDIRKSRKWLSVEEIRLLILALIVFIFLVVANIYLARTLPGGALFYLRWSAARTFLIDKVDPYSSTIPQDPVYKWAVSSTEQPYVLNDPFYIVMLYMPFPILREVLAFFLSPTSSFLDFSTFRGLWMLFSEFAIVGTIYYLFRLLEWEPPLWLLILLVCMGLFGYYSSLALISGNPTVILTFLFILILFALRSFHDELAGALLFLVAYQWEVSGLFFLFIILMVFANRRWGVLTGFGMSLFILLVISFIIYPAWGGAYIQAVLRDWYGSANLNFGAILSSWFPTSKVSVSTWISVILGGVLFLEWIGSIKADFRHILWTVSLTLAITPLMGLAIFPSNHAALLPALILVAMLVWERWTRQRVWFVLLVLFATFAVPYIVYVNVIRNYNRLTLDLLTVLPPISTVVGLYWMRWWAFRSPRTWFDQIGVRN